MDQKRVGYIDSLRGIACLFVLIAHIVSVSEVGSYVSGCGKIGVWLFMILSSFLMIYPYEKNRDKQFKILRFYSQKLLRIYPCYLLVLVGAYLSGFITSGRQLLAHIFIVEGIGHFWYMPVIIKLYIIFPLFILIRKSIKKDSVYLLTIVLFSALFEFMFPYSHYIENSISIRWYIPVFGMGICLATVVKRITEKQRRYWIADMGVVVCFGIIFMLTPFMKKIIFDISPSGWLQNKYLLIGFIWCCIIILIESGSRSKDILEKCQLLKKIGKISYPVYLVHYVVLIKLMECIQQFWILSVLTVVVSVLTAMVMHYYIEERIQRRKKSYGKLSC